MIIGQFWCGFTTNGIYPGGTKIMLQKGPRKRAQSGLLKLALKTRQSYYSYKSPGQQNKSDQQISQTLLASGLLF